MKKDTKKLKLTKLTVANLDRLKGGKDHCACQYTAGDNALNQLGTASFAVTLCSCNC
jgi:hypothetical protein